MRKAPDRGRRSKESDLDTTTAIYTNMLLGKEAVANSVALAETLECAALDFSLNSLHAIDRYLGLVLNRRRGLDGVLLLNTVAAVACYLGEVIRRGTPEGECHWTRVPRGSQQNAEIPINLGTFADIMLTAKHSEWPLQLTSYVAKRVSGKGSQDSAYDYAVAAMKRIWLSVTDTESQNAVT